MKNAKKRMSLLVTLLCAFVLVLSLGIISACGGSESASTGGAWYYGEEIPTSDLGQEGDYYLNTETLKSYVKEGKAWREASQDETGAKWYYGTVAPDSETGSPNDFYLNTATGELYQKTTDGWGTALFTLSTGHDGVMWFSGEGKPEETKTDLRGAQDGDFYLDYQDEAFDVYQRFEGKWQPLGSLKSEPQRGTFWFTGTGDPADAALSDVCEGDFYLRTFSDFSDMAGYQLYHFESGAWKKIMDDTAAREEPLSEYHITCTDDFIAFRDSVKAGNDFKGSTVYLDSKIDLSSFENWEPIGTDSTRFSGTFDGQGNVVSNLKIDRESEKFVGLFRVIGSGATVKNLTISNVEIKGKSNVGALAGGDETVSASTVTGVNVEGNIKIEGHYMVGGITGGANGIFTNCNVTGEDGSSISGSYSEHDLEGDNIGGLIGFMGGAGDTRSKIDGCHVSGVNVSGTRKVGGVVGFLYPHSVENSSFESGTVACNADDAYIGTEYEKIAVGGIVGQAGKSTDLAIMNNSVKDITLDVPNTFTFRTECRGDVLTSAILGNARDCNTREGLESAKTIEAEGNTAQNVTVHAKLSNVVYGFDTVEMGGHVYIQSLDIEEAGQLFSFNDLFAAKIVRPSTVLADWQTTVHIVNDIDLKDVVWKPLSGIESVIFDGGEGHKIMNMDMGGTSAMWAGFVADAHGVAFKNLTFENVNISGAQAGVVAGGYEWSAYAGLENITLAGNINITYVADANEAAPGLGVFVGAVRSGDLTAKGCKIAEHAHVTVTVKGLVPYAGGAATEGYYFGYTYNDGTVNKDAPAEKVQVAETATVTIVGVDKIVDPDGNVSVYSREGLASLKDMSAEQLNGKTVYIAQDIDFGGKSTPWTPISLPWSNSSHYTIDGMGNTLSNLYVNQAGAVGLFASFGHADAPATVKDIVFENADITTTGKIGGNEAYAGVLVGHAYANISGIQLKGDVHVQGVSFIGGIVGSSEGGKIENCTVDVSDSSYVKTENGMNAGGIVGFVDYAGAEISGCTSNIDVTSFTNAGGIVGKSGGNSDVTITDCTVEADLLTTQGNDYCASGMIGWLAAGSLTLSGCHFTGRISWVSQLTTGPRAGVNNLLTNIERDKDPAISDCSVTLLDADGGTVYSKTW